MKKQLLKSALIALAGIGLMSGSGWATPTTANYFTLSDYTTATSGSVNSHVSFSFSNFLAENNFFSTVNNEFGFYYIDSLNAIQTFSVIKPSNYTNPSIQVNFIFTSGDWWVSLFDNDIVDVDDKKFSTVFGFYIKEGSNTYYTDESKNTPNAERVTVDMISSETALINYTTDSTYQPATRSLTLSVVTDDVYPAPVPEPATMLLFGTGLVGLTSIARRKK